MQTVLPSRETILQELAIAPSLPKTISAPQKRTHYVAALNWLTKYQTSQQASSLKQVRGLLEAFHHFMDAEDLYRASNLITIQLNTPNQEELHNQLHTWGYCEEQVRLYEALKGKLDLNCESIFTNGLGLAYRTLGQYEKAVEYYQQSLSLAHQTQDVEGISIALCNLSTVFCLLEDYQSAIQCCQHVLQLAAETRNASLIGSTLGNMGLIFQSLEQYPQAIDCHEKYLEISQTLKDTSGELNALNGLGIAYEKLGAHQQAIECFTQSMSVANTLGDRFGKATALGNLGAAYLALEKYEQATEYFQAHLELSSDIGDAAGQARASENLNIARKSQHSQ